MPGPASRTIHALDRCLLLSEGLGIYGDLGGCRVRSPDESGPSQVTVKLRLFFIRYRAGPPRILETAHDVAFGSGRKAIIGLPEVADPFNALEDWSASPFVNRRARRGETA